MRQHRAEGFLPFDLKCTVLLAAFKYNKRLDGNTPVDLFSACSGPRNAKSSPYAVLLPAGSAVSVDDQCTLQVTPEPGMSRLARPGGG